MADIQKTVEIVFGGKNELSKTIGLIERDFGQLDTMVGKITGPLAGFADNILKADAALAALAIGGMALAIQKSGEFGGKFGEITTLIGTTGAPIDQFRTDILNYATGSTKSISEINQALYAAVSAGVDYTKSLEFMTAAEKLSVAGLANLGDTTKALVSTLNAYGASTDEATKYSDIMFTTVRLGQTTLGDLSTQLAKVTGLAANSGVPFETLSAAVAALTVAGLPTEQALTGIKAALTNIIKPTKDADETAQSLGIQFNATALKTKGFEGVLWDAWRATGGNTEKMAQLFGSVEALNAVLVLSADKTGKFKEAMTAMGTAGGATAEAYEKVAGSFENVNTRLKNSFEVTLVTIGDRLMPQYGEIATALSDLMKGIKVGVDSGAFDPLFKYLDETGGAIAQWISGVAAALPEAFKMINFDSLINALNALGRAFGSYLGDLDLSKPKDLAAAMQLLIDTVAGLINVTAGMVDSFRPFIEQIGAFLLKMAQADEKTQKSTGSVLALAKAVEMFGLGMAALITFADQYKVSLASAFDVIVGSGKAVLNFFQLLIDITKGALLTVEKGFLDFLDTITLGLSPGIKVFLDTVDKQLSETTKSFDTNSEDMKAALSQIADGFLEVGASAGKGTDSVEKMRDRFGDVGESAANATPPIDSLSDELEMLGEMVVTPKVAVAVDEKKLDIVVQSVAKAIPAEKKVKVELTADEKKMKEQSALIQKAMDVKVKVDVAQIEAAAKTTQSMFSTLDTRLKGSADVYATLVKGLSDSSLSYGTKSTLETLLSKEAEHRAKAMKQAEELTEQQIKLNKLKLEAVARGDNEITVKADGLKPHLEMIMWEVLEAIQIRASATQSDFLLGYK